MRRISPKTWTDLTELVAFIAVCGGVASVYGAGWAAIVGGAVVLALATVGRIRGWF